MPGVQRQSPQPRQSSPRPSEGARFFPPDRTIRRARRILAPLKRYHQHQVVGLEHIPRSGPVLLVLHHSLATYDGLLLGMTILDQVGRAPRGLGDNAIFRVPWLRGVARRAGIVPASPHAGAELLAAGELVAVAPGGMRESLRTRDERYRVAWSDRRGFARLALRTGAPIVLAACPRADDIYTVYPSRITRGIYQRFHLPLPVFRGLGPTPLPRPTALVHHVAAPLRPPAHDPADEEAQIAALHAAATARMKALLARR